MFSITSGRDVGAWWHEHFVRARPEKLKHIVRIPVKSKAPKAKNHTSNGEGHYRNMTEEVPSMSADGISDRNQKMTKEASSVTTDGDSDRNEEFERLDKEFEAWFHETKSCQQNRASPVLSSIDHDKNNDGGAPARTDTCRICTDEDFSRPSSVSSGPLPIGAVEPDPATSNGLGGSEAASPSAELSQVETYELSNFIDEMIGLLD